MIVLIKKIFLVAITFLMTACGSLLPHERNRYNPYYKGTNGKEYSFPQLPKVKKCFIYEPPSFTSTPSAPIAEYSSLKYSKQAKKDKVLLDYIEELRTHISTTNREHSTAYSKYINRCLSE